jgi:hypothetical protein
MIRVIMIRAAIPRFLCVLGALCGLSLSAAALDREAFTITKYDLQVTLDPAQQRLGARGTITIRNDSAQPQKVVALQVSSSLHWRAIRAAGKPLQFVSQPFVSDIDHTGGLSEAIVTLPAEIRAKDAVELEIGYEGVIPQDSTRLTRVGVPTEIARHTSWDQIGTSFTAVRGAGYVAWYPITTESADFSEGNSLFEVTDRWRARAAGSEFKARLGMEGDGAASLPLIICTPGSASFMESLGGVQRTSTECSWAKLGTATPTFAMARYDNWFKPPLSLLSFPGHERGAEKYSAALAPAAKFVTGWFGTPAAPIAIADLADPHAPPFESGTLLLVSMAGEDTKLAGINLVHELVHSALPSQRPWVYEGLAHFAEAMYREQQGGREAALDVLGIHRSSFLDSEKETAASEKSAGQPLATTFDETYYRSKAAYVWWMLRDMVGDEVLKQAIRNYKAADDTDPKYIEHLVEAAAKRDLGWFFEDWVYQDRGLPNFKVQSAHLWQDDKSSPAKQPSEKDPHTVTLTIENLGAVGAELPFTVRCAGSDTAKRLEIRAKSTATTRISVLCTPLEVVLNDGSVPESDLTNNAFKIATEPQ